MKAPDRAALEGRLEQAHLAAWGMSLCVELHERNGDREAARRCNRQGLAHLAEMDRLRALLTTTPSHEADDV